MDKEIFFTDLINWYRSVARKLPWRLDRSPYRVWISEVMLQQTQVSTVIGYYQRWMKRFPDIKNLAFASKDDVLMLWQGLGYYRRATAIYEASKILIKRPFPHFPTQLNSLMKLPGIGRYTASAILSFAYHQRQPMIEVNISRVFTRFFFQTKNNTEDLWKLSDSILPQDGSSAAEINEALMELGATVCSQTKPLCEKCPLSSGCKAYLLGKESEAIVSKKKSPIINVQSHIFLLSKYFDNRKYFATIRRSESIRQNGLWCFPTLEHTPFITLMDKDFLSDIDKNALVNKNKNYYQFFLEKSNENTYEKSHSWEKSIGKIKQHIATSFDKNDIIAPYRRQISSAKIAPVFSFLHRYTQFKIRILVWNVSPNKQFFLKKEIAHKNNFSKDFLWIEEKKIIQLAMPTHHQKIRNYLLLRFDK